MDTNAESRTAATVQDDYGILPIEFRPGLLKKLLGRTGFTVGPEQLSLHSESGDDRIPYREIRDVSSSGASVALDVARNDRTARICLRTGNAQEAGKVAALIRRLAEESKRFFEILGSDLPIAALGSLVDESLGFRGSPFVSAADMLLAHAVRKNASDIHLEPLPGQVRVTVRIARDLIEAGTYRQAFHEGLCSRLKFLAGCHSHRTGITQEGAFSLAGGVGEARLSVYPAADGERVALRFIRPIAFPDLPSLGWLPETVAAWRRLLADGPGLALIAGPIGSGKTTALYATLAELAHSDAAALRRVATIEDPIEGRVPGICQSALSSETGASLDSAFKHLLRQDPDVMALGEIRDAACLREALQAGQAGHLVLATFHAADAAGALERLKKLGLEPGLVGASLKGILSVRLDKGMKPSANVWRPDHSSDR